MKKLTLIAAILICGLLYTTCDLFKDMVKEPEVTLDSVDFIKIDFKGLTLQSNIKVKNNISVNIPFPDIDFDLHVFDIESSLVKGTISSEGSLKSNDSTIVHVPTVFTYENLISLISALTDENKKENPLYKIKLTAHIPVQGNDFTFPFEHEGKIPIARLPEITFASAPSASFTYGLIPGIPTGGKIEFSLDVKNKSNVAILIKDLSLDVKIGNTPLPKQGVVTQPKLNPGSTGNIPFQFSLNAADALSILPSVISGGISGFNLTGNYKFSLPDFPFLNELGDSITLP